MFGVLLSVILVFSLFILIVFFSFSLCDCSICDQIKVLMGFVLRLFLLLLMPRLRLQCMKHERCFLSVLLKHILRILGQICVGNWNSWIIYCRWFTFISYHVTFKRLCYLGHLWHSRWEFVLSLLIFLANFLFPECHRQIEGLLHSSAVFLHSEFPVSMMQWFVFSNEHLFLWKLCYIVNIFTSSWVPLLDAQLAHLSVKLDSWWTSEKEDVNLTGLDSQYSSFFLHKLLVVYLSNCNRPQ